MSTALEYALRDNVDPEGKGVLTKLDNLTASSDKERVSKVLGNETKPLKSYGYFGVVNRSQDSIDKGIGMKQTRNVEEKVFEDPANRNVKTRLSTDTLQNFISCLLANKMEGLIPDLRQRASEDLQNVTRKLREHGKFHDDDDDYDYEDLIAKLVERSMEKIKINLQSLNTQVVMEYEATGAQLNRKIKNGALAASKEARTTLSVDQFHQRLTVAKRNVAAIGDSAFPEGLILDIGVAILTECYREPFQQLLDDSCSFLKEEISNVLRETLSMYQKFKL